jgi:hypothetical protein
VAVNLIVLFVGVQTLALLIIALSLYNIWRNIEFKPNIFLPPEDASTDEKSGNWQKSEKKFRAKVYGDLSQSK